MIKLVIELIDVFPPIVHESVFSWEVDDAGCLTVTFDGEGERVLCYNSRIWSSVEGIRIGPDGDTIQ